MGMTRRRLLLHAARAICSLTPYTAVQYGARRFTSRADALREATLRSSDAAGAAVEAGSDGGSLVGQLLGSNNQFTQGGLTLMVVGAALAAARTVLMQR